jgi:hypothetical protein
LSAVPFSALPDEARLWVFASPHPLGREEGEILLAAIDDFLDGWLAHGHMVVGGRAWKHDRFLLIGADEAATGVSGCSIDSLYRVLKRLEREASIRLLDSSLVWYRASDGEIVALPRAEFRARARSGELDGDTVVFDHTVRSVGQLRQGEWEKPAARSWHIRLL